MMQVFMSWLYPVLAAALLVLAMLEFLTWLWKDREPIIIHLALRELFASISIGLLAITTGGSPVLSIDVLRPWIVVTRLALLVVLIPCIYYQWRRLHE